MSEFYINPVGGMPVVIAAALALMAALSLRPSLMRTSRTRSAVLIALRGVVVLLVLVAMLRPTWVVSQIKKQSAALIVLCDVSRSMQVSDAFGGKSRAEQMHDLVDSAAPALRELDEDFDVQLYAFDQDVRPLDLGDGLATLGQTPAGEQSAIGAALEDVLRRNAGQRIAGVLLLSDGAHRAMAPRDTPPQSAAHRAADAGAPLYTFSFGEARGRGQGRDLAVSDLVTGETVFVKNNLEATGSLRADGFANNRLTVQMLFETAPGEMEVVDATEVTPNSDGQLIPIRLSHVPLAAGEYKLTLRTQPQDGELVTTNNELSTFVTVLKGGLNVLYLEGSLRPESRFIRASIDASPDIQLDYQWIDARRRDQWPVDLRDAYKPEDYDVFMLGDLDAAALPAEMWQQIADRVQKGAGLIMLGGFHSFGAGGYRETPLADVLPVVMGRFDRQSFDEPVRDDLHVEGPLKLQATDPIGLSHPVMQLATGEQNRQVWQKLPPLDGANLFRTQALKPNAVVLAESQAAGGNPLLVAGSSGGGRVLAFAGDSTWHWPLEGFETEHKRFWRQVVLWLARKDETSDSDVWVKLDQRRIQPGGRIEFAVGANSPEGEPITDATFEAQVILPDGTEQPVRLASDGERMIGSFLDTQSAGDYAVQVSASRGGEPLGSGRARFLVYEQDLELDNPAADPGLLASMAQITSSLGGQALAPEEMPVLVDRLRETPPEYDVVTQEKRTYWDTWPFFLLFVAVIGTEWYLRKRWHLV